MGWKYAMQVFLLTGGQCSSVLNFHLLDFSAWPTYCQCQFCLLCCTTKIQRQRNFFFSGQNTNTNKTLRTHASTIQRVGFTNNSPFLVICIYNCGEDAPFDLSGGRSMVLTIFGISWSLTGALLSLPGVGFILAVDFAKALISSVLCAFGNVSSKKFFKNTKDLDFLKALAVFPVYLIPR